MTINLAGKRALVTGGDSGIGEAVALSLAEAGAAVAVNYRKNATAAAGVVKTIESQGGKAFALQADVADPAAVERMFQAVDTAWGGIDILIANAGMDGKRAMSWESEPADWRQVIEVNLFGAYFCARQALQRMVPRKSGVILATSSVHEEIAWSGYSAYAASKAAVSMLIKTLAQEAAPHGVRVLAVAPGAIKTAINRPVWSDPKGLADLVEKIPLGRMGETKEVAQMVTVLVSDVASYATGRTFFIDGGMTDYPSFAHGG
jgi:NAD(P)-dependent dehydrogenase (short-subunit alcohol dehydrogenase family)